MMSNEQRVENIRNMRITLYQIEEALEKHVSDLSLSAPWADARGRLARAARLVGDAADEVANALAVAP